MVLLSSWTWFRTHHAPNGTGRGRKTAAIKFYELRDNLGSVTDSSFEIASGIAFAATLLRVTGEESPSRALRIAVAVTGVALALSRAPGPLWILVALIIAAALAGPRTLVRRLGAPTMAALVGGIALNRIWEAMYGAHVPLDLHIRSGLGAAFDQWRTAAPDLVGRFSYLDWSLPLWVYLVWAALFLWLVGVALVRGTPRERWILVGSFLGAVILPPLFWLIFLRRTGFGLQGRHVLPTLVVVPLLAGEILRCHGVTRRLPWVLPIGVALVQLAAFFFNGQRAAVGVGGGMDYPTHAAWIPPLGWPPWLLCAAVGALLLAASGFHTVRGRSSAERRAVSLAR